MSALEPVSKPKKNKSKRQTVQSDAPWVQHVQQLSQNPQPQELNVLTDHFITSMAKKHGILRVTQEAKANLRRFAFITMEGIIDDAKLYAYARKNYPGLKNPDKPDLPPKHVPASIVILPQDIAAALKNRGITHY